MLRTLHQRDMFAHSCSEQLNTDHLDLAQKSRDDHSGPKSKASYLVTTSALHCSIGPFNKIHGERVLEQSGVVGEGLHVARERCF